MGRRNSLHRDTIQTFILQDGNPYGYLLNGVGRILRRPHQARKKTRWEHTSGLILVSFFLVDNSDRPQFIDPCIDNHTASGAREFRNACLARRPWIRARTSA